MKRPHWKLDDSRSPVVILHVADSDGTQQPDVETMFQLLEELKGRRTRHAIVMDLTHTTPDAVRRKRFVEWIKANMLTVKHNVIAVAGVAPNPIQRGLVTGVLWFIEPPCPVELFPNRLAAIAWIEEQIEKS